MNIKTYLALLIFALFTISACSAAKEQPAPATNMANPASVYCEQNGNQLEIRTASDGSQSGACIFSDGSECNEWAYFKGECAAGDSLLAKENTPMPNSPVDPGTSESVNDWWGLIKGNQPGAQFDDYFERQDLGQVISFGIDSLVPDVKIQIESLRDSGRIVHLFGTLVSNVPDVNGTQIQVERIVVE